jgi:hypothetical protein
MRFRTYLSLVSLALAAGAAAPVTSCAALTTIGSPTLSTSGLTNVAVGGTYIPYSGAVPAPEYVSPVEGTIVAWRIGSGSAGAKVQLRVLRPAGGGGKFTGAGTSAMQMTSGSFSMPDTFPTSLPIKAGDIIGLDNSSSALIFKEKVFGEYPQVFSPALADGAPAVAPTPVSGSNGFQLQVNADIQPTSTGSGGNGSGGSGDAGSGGGGGGGSGAAGSGGQPGSSTLAGLKIAPNAFSAAGSGGSIAKKGKPKAGATVSYTDSQAATMTLTVLQSQPGRRNKQGVCVKPPRKPRGKRCTRLVTIGSFTHTDTAGANSFHFTGRVNGRKLKPGGYQLQAVARNATGLASNPVATSFRVKQ